MIRLFMLLWLGFGTMAFSNQVDSYQSGVLILKDGRILAIRGDYEVLGDEVQFMDDRGERVSLPAKLIDFEKTDAQNLKIREKARDTHKIVDDGSLYSKVMRDKEKRAREAKKAEREGKTADPSTVKKRPTIVIPPQNKKADTFKNPKEWFEKSGLDTQQVMDQLQLSTSWIVGLVVILAVLGLISFITEIYILITSYQDSAGWGSLLTFLFVANTVVAFILPAELNPIIALVVIYGLAGGRILAVLGYIVLIFPGNRLRIFLCWTAPLWFIVVAGAFIWLKMS